MKVKVKQFLCRYITGSEDTRLSRHSTHEGGKVVSLTHRPPFTFPGNIPGTHVCWMLAPEGF